MCVCVCVDVCVCVCAHVCMCMHPCVSAYYLFEPGSRSVVLSQIPSLGSVHMEGDQERRGLLSIAAGLPQACFESFRTCGMSTYCSSVDC